MIDQKSIINLFLQNVWTTKHPFIRTYKLQLQMVVRRRRKMNKNPLPLLTFLFLLSNDHVVAGFPSDLFKRQAPGESLTDGLPDWFWDGVTGLGKVTDEINGWANDFVLPDAPTSDPVAVPGTTIPDGKNWQDDRGPDIQLEIVAPVKDLGDDCKPATLPGEQGAMVSQCLNHFLASAKPIGSYLFPFKPGLTSDPCNVATAQIIYPFNCRTSGKTVDMIAAQCQAIEVALTGFVGKTGYQTIRRSCGTFFYTASLTPAQIQKLQNLELPPGLGPDRKMSLLNDPNPGPGPSPIGKRGSFQGVEKRKVPADLISQSDAGWDLMFVSAHPPTVRSPTTPVPAYFYYNNFVSSKQNQPVLVYVADSGADGDLKEFQREYPSNGQMVTENIIKGWIHAGPTTSARADDWWSLTKGDYDDSLGHGTCVAQKIGGLSKGINKNPYMIIVRLEFQAPLHSMILALEKIADDLSMRKQQGEDVRGNVVINISVGYEEIGSVNMENMLPLLERLFNEFQAVIVAAAGNDAMNGDLETHVHPAAFAKLPDSPIISVGGVGYTGDRVDWSRGGLGLTVSAPHFVTCMHQRPPLREEQIVDMSGTSFACPIVSGVVSAWLSDDELGPKLRGDLTNVPRRVKALVEKLSYKRAGASVTGVWNGVDANNPQDWPPEIPILS